MTAPLAPAASLMLLRDRIDPAGLDVLMIERRAELAFAGGALVFPGGRIDAADADPSWRDGADGLTGDRDTDAAMIAAVRETFEETGLLIARANGALVGAAAVEAADALRRASDADPTVFRRLADEAGLHLALDLLTPFSRWIAPPHLSRRFDARFFIAPAPPDQTPTADGGEATAAMFVDPAQAVAARASGARRIIFPTARNLELLALSASADSAAAAAKARRIEPIEPRVAMRDGVAYVTIPDNLGYPVTEERADIAMRD